MTAMRTTSFAGRDAAGYVGNKGGLASQPEHPLAYRACVNRTLKQSLPCFSWDSVRYMLSSLGMLVVAEGEALFYRIEVLLDV